MLDEKMIEIEELEKHYLNKYYYFLKFAEDEMIYGFKTKFSIKDDWQDKWNPTEEGKGISDFATGAERIVYSLLNGKGIGQPNSAPIGSDLFFETQDAYVHIDLKTVQTRNIGDYKKSIFVGNNQNSYNGNFSVSGKERVYDQACLPTFYTKNKGTDFQEIKQCISLFITILYDEESLEILSIAILCMPNGELYKKYKGKALSAGKVLYPKGHELRDTHAKSVRFNFSEVNTFKLLGDDYKRIKIVYFNENMKEEYLRELDFIKAVYESQKA